MIVGDVRTEPGGWRADGHVAGVRPHAEGWFGRPGLSGHRPDSSAGDPAAGHDWSPHFRPAGLEHHGRRASIEAADAAAEIGLAIPAQRALTAAVVLIQAV